MMKTKTQNTPESVWTAFRETDRLIKEPRADWEQRMKNLEKQIGGVSNNHGFLAEEYFFNSIDKNKEPFFGENFEIIERSKKRKFKNGVGNE